MTLALAIIALLTPLVGLLVWYVQKRGAAPTTAERIDAAASVHADLLERIQDLRAAGDDAAADALLEQLRIDSLGHRSSDGNPDTNR